MQENIYNFTLKIFVYLNLWMTMSMNQQIYVFL